VWSAAVVSALALVARLAHWPAREYLGLIRPNRRDTVVALVLLGIFLSGWAALLYLLGVDDTGYEVKLYLNAQKSGALPLLWFAIVVAAPVGEEILFRGFLYRGWVQSERGVVSGVVIISALWAAMHIQYDFFLLLEIYSMGLLLGWVRWRSGTTVLPMLIHGINNLCAMLWTAVTVEWLA
jgi:uncharacterized protein